MTDIPAVPSLLLIDGQERPFNAEPCFHARGISLQNHGQYSGPHFSIQVSDEQMKEVLSSALALPLKVDFELDELGHIDGVQGRAACDSGTMTRKIMSLSFVLRQLGGLVSFSFSGTASAVDPKTDLMPGTFWSRSPYEFSVSFQIQATDLSKYFRSKSAYESLLLILGLYTPKGA